MNIAELKPNIKNPRKITDKKLKDLQKSMAKFGDLGGIVFNKRSGQLVGGHQRISLLQGGAIEVGEDNQGFIIKDGHKFALRIVDWDANTEKAANIAANKGAGEWDMDRLGEWFRELNQDEFDLDLTMFDEEERAQFFIEPEIFEEGLTDPDSIPENVETRCKPGDLWLLGNHRLLCGDSTDVLQVERLMNGENAELCFTSPPYNLGSTIRGGKSLNRIYGEYDDKKSPGDYMDLLSGFTSIALSVSEIAIINIQMLSSNRISLISWLDIFKSNLIDCMIWTKSNPQPAASEKVINRGFEFLFIFDSNQNPNTAVRTSTFDRGTFNNVYVSSVSQRKDENGDHRAIFSVDFASHYLTNFSGPLKRIYEPFCGSGTTLIACEKTKRECYGMEIDPHYCDVIIERWEKYTGQKATLSAGIEY